MGEDEKITSIPKGFAHGFQVLSKEAEIEYLVDNEYAPDFENGILWNDNYININWPISDAIISEKDKRWPIFDNSSDDKFINEYY